MIARIFNDQDDSAAWTIENRGCFDMFIRKFIVTAMNKLISLISALSARSFSSGNLICNNWNIGKCFREYCKYAYVYFTCEHNHLIMICLKSHFLSTIINANFISLKNRIIKVEWLSPLASTSSTLTFILKRFSYTSYDPSDVDLSYQEPLLINGWERWLKNHFDIIYVKIISSIFRKSVKIGYQESLIAHRNHNYSSVTTAPNILTADFQKQLQNSRIVQVHPHEEARYVCLSLRLISKYNDDWRRIHDLS